MSDAGDDFWHRRSQPPPGARDADDAVIDPGVRTTPTSHLPAPAPRVTHLADGSTVERVETPATKTHREIAERNSWAFVDLDQPNLAISPELAEVIPAHVARQFSCVPVRLHGRTLTVAVEDPGDLTKAGDLRSHVPGHTVRLAYANPLAIARLIENIYSASSEAQRLAGEKSAPTRRNAASGGDLGRIADSEGSGTAKMVDLILEQGVREHASDIHIESTADGVVVRLSVDGKLRVLNRYPRSAERGILTKIKVDAQMATDNFLVPESGVLQFLDPRTHRLVDIRVEVAPTAWGSSATLRLQTNIWRDMTTLGFGSYNEERFRRALAEPYGVILATGPTGSGKSLALSTRIPTPTGYTTMGELREGDAVLGRDGKPCRVTHPFDVNPSPELYRVRFSDGQAIIADRHHQWLVSEHFFNPAIPLGESSGLTRMSTGDLVNAGAGQGGARYAVPIPMPLDLPHSDLPVEPYTLGAWLGDGHSAGGRLTADPANAHVNSTGMSDQEHLLAFLRAAGVSATPSEGSPFLLNTSGLAPLLRGLDLINNKHVPLSYLRASHDQRLALLQGVMDTDGSIAENGTCSISLSDGKLAQGVLELIRSLGIKAAIHASPSGYRDEAGRKVDCKTRYRITFTTATTVFRLPRKAERVPDSVRETQRWLYITAIESVEPGSDAYEPARCIMVDSDDHTYLCGEGYVVTSNSTLLYSGVREKISPETKIITLEDPIEYKVPEGVTQIAVNVDRGVTFARGLRSILRQAPNVVLVGEIRDEETAETAVDAAMTGHLVLSTLHTNSAAGVVPRLVRMGVEPYLLGSSLLGATAQRLVRELCERCRVDVKLTDEVVDLGGFAEIVGAGRPPFVFEANPKGCERCKSGFTGRVPIHEVMLASKELADAIAERAPEPEIEALARKAGMIDMREDGWAKIVEGRTSIAEVNANTRRALA